MEPQLELVTLKIQSQLQLVCEVQLIELMASMEVIVILAARLLLVGPPCPYCVTLRAAQQLQSIQP
jgi:hypothetical protein